MTDTARFALPLLEPGQAQKELTHNEALAALDLIAQANVVAVGFDTPPGAPSPGQCWIVGASPTGAWAGAPHRLAGWTAGGWRFVDPVEGMAAWDVATATIARFVGGAWRVAGAAIAAPVGGTTIDTEARTAVAAILAILRAQGFAAS